MKKIAGGVCAAKGFLAGGVHGGFRKNTSKKDLAVIFSEVPATAASVYTQNIVKGAPIYVTKEHLKNGMAQAIICNSGNANTCNANGLEIAEETCKLLADALKINKDDVIVASTGVIGQAMTMEPFEKGIPLLAGALDHSEQAADDAANAILTTDTVKKEIAIEFTVGGKTCHIGGIAKGSGMIHPNMATMLVFITTDVAIAPDMLQKALSKDILDTFNMISVDGDTSTNDMVSVLANGLAGNELIGSEGEDYTAFCLALGAVNSHLCQSIAKDGEGASKQLNCIVSGAPDKDTARKVAKSVICSSLFKAAMFGCDANWGRVLCAIGYSGAALDVSEISVSFSSTAGMVDVCKDGYGIDFSEDLAKKVLSEGEIDILINLGDGAAFATAWGCDLTYDYVKINGDYRS